MSQSDFVEKLKKEKTPIGIVRSGRSITDEISGNWIMVDISAAQARAMLKRALDGAKTVIYNGTAGIYENKDFKEGTDTIIDTLQQFKGRNKDATLIGLGGDGVKAILACLGQKEADETFDLLSTMGGSALTYWSGKELLAMKWIDDKLQYDMDKYGEKISEWDKKKIPNIRYDNISEYIERYSIVLPFR